MSLPNFLIIGAAKAGTTSLWHYLRQHPDVYMSPVKEPAYFASAGTGPEAGRVDAVRTREAYEQLFAAATTERAIGEASPQYLNDPHAPARVATELGDVRLIVSLRHPVDRAYASYLGRRAGGTEPRSVDEALRRDTYYFESSLYQAPLTRWLARFDRRRVLVLLFDDLAADPSATLPQISAFLTVDAAFAFDVSERHGAGVAPRSAAASALFWSATHAVRRHLPASLRGTGLAGRVQRPLVRRPDPLPDAVRARLQADFRDDILATQALIGRSLAHWLT
jgi:hypothetical protein